MRHPRSKSAYPCCAAAMAEAAGRELPAAPAAASQSGGWSAARMRASRQPFMGAMVEQVAAAWTQECVVSAAAQAARAAMAAMFD